MLRLKEAATKSEARWTVCLLVILFLASCGGSGAGGGGDGTPPAVEELYEFTLSDGTDVSVMSPVLLTLSEAAPGSYPSGAEGPVIDVDGSLGPGQSVTITLTNDAGFPAGIAVLHNDGGPYWDPVPTDISVDQKTISATLTDLSPVGVGIPVTDVEVDFDELAAFHGETVTVEYTVEPADATDKGVNIWYSGWAAEATDAVVDDGEIELTFNGEGCGEVIIQSQYEPAMTSFSVRSIREIDLEDDQAVACRVRPDPFEAGENYYYVGGLSDDTLYVASIEDVASEDGLSDVDREVIAAIAEVGSSDEQSLVNDGHVYDAKEPLINYYITSLNDTAPLVFLANGTSQFFAVTDGSWSEAGDLDFSFNLSVKEYTGGPGDLLRIETYGPSEETEFADTSMAIIDANGDFAAGAFDVSADNKFSRLLVDKSTLLGCIIAVAGQREFHDDLYDPTGGYAIMVTSDASETTIPVAAGYPNETDYEVMDGWLLDGTDLCVQIGHPDGLPNPGTRYIDFEDSDLTELEADFMWWDP